MVLIGDQKFACQTCIKGHRSSNCNHADRPLFPIKRKGRPTTQCDHCRELRKTKRVHIKCMCGSKNSNTTGPTSPVTLKSSPTSTPPLSDGSASDSDHSSCACGSNQECHCWTPRESVTSDSAKRSRVRTADQKADTLIKSSVKPLLPYLEDRPQPSVVRHERVHNDNSPYGQAYAVHHQPHNRPVHADPTPLPSIEETTLYDPSLILPPDFQLPTLCSCTVGCRCLGCTTLHSNTVDTSSHCSEQGACGNCFDCSVLSTPLSQQYNSYSTQDIDMWIRQTTAQSTDSTFPDLFIPDLNIPSMPFEPNTNTTMPVELTEEGIWMASDLGVYPTFSSLPSSS